MTAQPIEYLSNRPHHKSWAILWTPDDSVSIKGVIQISHGMCEYIERYADFAAWLCARGYAVCGNDHMGHKNTALITSQRLGYFGGIGRWPSLVEDLELLRKKLAPRFEGVPWILLGHSMGSFIARLYAEKYGGCIDALILSGTAGPSPMPAAGRAMARGIVAYKGPMHISKSIEKMQKKTFVKALERPKTSSDWISHDADIVDKYVHDPYCTFTFTASAYHDLFAMIEQCNRSKWFHSLPRALPVYIFAGNEDPVGDYGKGPRFVANKLKNAGMSDVTLKIYSGGRHEMLNEVNRLEVYGDVLQWLESNVAAEKQSGQTDDT